MNINTDYDFNNLTVLCYLMNTYGSDKSRLSCGGHHNYTSYYFKLFEPIMHLPLRIFELGIGTNNVLLPSNMGKDGKPGASLRGWRDFFSNSKIYGADIDKDILFNEERITTFYCDQLDINVIKNMWNEEELQEDFDIIIEDGLHNYEANKIFFENSFHKLKVGGIYIIEDIIQKELPRYENLIKKWISDYKNLEVRVLNIPNRCNNYDNILIIIKKTSQYRDE